MGFCLLLGNDAAQVLAEAVSGSIDDFVELMNTKAIELGCTNTNFVNPHGYHDDLHYSTARDMMKILSYCIKNDTFIEITSTKDYTIEATNKTTEPRYLQNSNRLIETTEDSIYSRFYEYCIGGKTGYTEQAGRCLVSFGKKDDKYILTGTFNAMKDDDGQDAKFTDTINLYEYCFNNFNKNTIASKDSYSFNYTNEKVHTKYTLGIKEDIYALLSNDSDSLSEIEYTTDIYYDKLNFKEDNANFDTSYGKITFTINTDIGEQY